VAAEFAGFRNRQIPHFQVQPLHSTPVISRLPTLLRGAWGAKQRGFLCELGGATEPELSHDSSTNNLIHYYGKKGRPHKGSRLCFALIRSPVRPPVLVPAPQYVEWNASLRL